MIVRVKNNRLFLEAKVKNLSEVSDEELRRVAAKYQIGWQRMIPKEVPVTSRGVTRMSEEMVMEPKPRKILEDEIRKNLVVSLIVPKEYWTQDQQDIFTSNDLINEKDISKEIAIKKDAKIQQDLPPFEETKDKFAEARLYADLTENQWEYFKQYYNYTMRVERDAEGKIVDRKKSYVHRLVEVDRIPENAEDEARLAEAKGEKVTSEKTKDVDTKN